MEHESEKVKAKVKGKDNQNENEKSQLVCLHCWQLVFGGSESNEASSLPLDWFKPPTTTTSGSVRWPKVCRQTAAFCGLPFEALQ